VLDGVLTRTLPLTLTPIQRARLQSARIPGPAPLLDQRPTRVQRTVSRRGGTQIIGQRIQVGLRYPGQIVTIEVAETTLRLYNQHKPLDQKRSLHQPQEGPPTQGLRSTHQPHNRLGPVTHHLKPNGTHHVESASQHYSWIATTCTEGWVGNSAGIIRGTGLTW
jgi:hypothetical protein